MRFADDAALAAHVQGLLDATLTKARWTHEGHIAATAGLMLLHPEIDLARDLRGLIMRLNDSHGVPNSDTRGYHETITRFFLLALRDALAKDDAMRPAHARVNALLDAGMLGTGKRALAPYWSEAVLFSVAARRGWVPPDLAPLPYAPGA
jgi:CO/xanthine dehydrogenase Mo-binding subunit